jgi:hypothetical protein
MGLLFLLENYWFLWLLAVLNVVQNTLSSSLDTSSNFSPLFFLLLAPNVLCRASCVISEVRPILVLNTLTALVTCLLSKRVSLHLNLS